MTTSSKDNILSAITDLAIEDLMNMSDEEVREEAKSENIDLEILSNEVRSEMRDAAALVRRSQLQRAKENQDETHSLFSLKKPAIDKIKQIVEQTFQTNPRLGMAFRDGKKKSDHDWETTFEDLIEMGEIDPKDYED